MLCVQRWTDFNSDAGDAQTARESASELYRPNDRRLSAKSFPTFAYRGVSRSQRDGSPTAVISAF
jgi:hypothetical protein